MQGISDCPAWVVVKANQYARFTGKTPFVIYQGAWNILQRDFEREILPMAINEGMALAPWGVLGQGKLRTDEEEQRRLDEGDKGVFVSPYVTRWFDEIRWPGRNMASRSWERTEQEKVVSQALEKVAKEVGAKHITSGTLSSPSTAFLFSFS